MGVITLNNKLKPFITEKARYKIAYGGRGSSKSWTVARMLLLKCMEKQMRILCTREIQNSIKDSVHKLLKDQIELLDLKGWVVQNDSITFSNGSEFIFKGLYTNLSKIKSLEGIDVCWIEEAETISQESWDILDPTIRKEESEVWVTFNPRLAEDTIYAKFILRTPPNSIVIRINYDDNKYFPDVLLKQLEHMKATEYELYRHVWLGECKQIGDTRIFSSGELEDAVAKLHVEDEGEVIWGLDVARFGDDRSVLAQRENYLVKTLQKWQGLSTTALADRIHSLYNTAARKPDAIFVDTIGVGGGVADQLSQRGLPIIDANVSAKADNPTYINKRAEMYMVLKEQMRFLKLPEDRDLIKELLQLEYFYNNAGKTQLISKDLIKKEYGKSPDLADALALTYFTKIYQSAFNEDWGGGY